METDESDRTLENAAHGALMQSLSTRLDGLCSVIPPQSRIVFLDYPVHFNVGDLLIHLGTERFFARNGCRVLARLSTFDVCTVHPERTHSATLKRWVGKYLETLPGDVIVVFHGGGNFGDLYPYHQLLREEVVALAPARRMVMMPQSLHFSDQTKQRRSLERLAHHSDLHIFLRDTPSHEACSQFMPGRAHLMPDMAHALWGQLPSSAARAGAGTLRQERNDGESLTEDAEGLDGAGSMDWSDLVYPMDMLAMRVIRKGMTWGVDPGHRLLGGAWNLVRDGVVGRAVSLFLEHPALSTDRLHGLILASLLSRQVEYRDNSYGKLSRYAGAWLGDSPLITRDPAAGETTR